MDEDTKKYFNLKVAIFFGYNGKEYFGSQCQKDASIKTVEKTLFDGLVASKLIKDTQICDLKKLGWNRAARTDKGVHALSNGINVKLTISEDFLLKQENEINERDEEIKEGENRQQSNVNVVQEQQKSLQVGENNQKQMKGEETDLNVVQEQQASLEVGENNQKQMEGEETDLNVGQEKIISFEVMENRRKKKESRAEQRRIQEEAEEGRRRLDVQKLIGCLNSNLPGEVRIISIKNVNDTFDMRKHCKFRFYEYLMPLYMYQNYSDMLKGVALTQDEENALFERVTNIACRFKGTHNFHNYTHMMKAKDPKCMRYIIDIRTELVESPDKSMKFVRFVIQGQSFIYHQIRKMMGIICFIIQENYPDSFIDTTFFHNVVKIWIAPAHGLFLNQLNFSDYNKKAKTPESIEFDQTEQQRIADMRLIIERTIMDPLEVNQIYKLWLKNIKEGTDIGEEKDFISGDIQEE